MNLNIEKHDLQSYNLKLNIY